MKKSVSIILAAMLTAILLAGCSSYVSSYSAVALITSNVSDSAYMDYWQLTGTMVFDLKAKENDSRLKYSGEVGSGSVTVYYDDDGNKKELFTLKDNERVDDSLKLSGTGKIYVIVETDGKSENGEFQFEIQ